MKISSLLGAVAAAATLNLHVAPAASQTQDGAPSFEVVSDEELGEQRGGFLVASDLAFQFGAVMRTYENGALSLQTQLVWTPDGPLVEQSFGEGVTALTSAELDSIGVGHMYQTAGGAIVMHDLTQGQFTNLLLNTASDRAFSQDLAITLVLPGVGAAPQDIGHQLAGLRLADELNLASVGALGGD